MISNHVFNGALDSILNVPKAAGTQYAELSTPLNPLLFGTTQTAQATETAFIARCLISTPSGERDYYGSEGVQINDKLRKALKDQSVSAHPLGLFLGLFRKIPPSLPGSNTSYRPDMEITYQGTNNGKPFPVTIRIAFGAPRRERKALSEKLCAMINEPSQRAEILNQLEADRFSEHVELSIPV